ncbi:hypothetical protein [Streptomyces sp. G-G2]|uniref:hypothetical protein n=1 Tax=Streptomyces sp. G-G2 TaxID=3046201 RepID=UPI0024B95198|nr:hypothetical protein [Streptomyces sp. G-G2]MDJ0380728.1 hypothetical protein [Streptomyces sp. G-G2]
MRRFTRFTVPAVLCVSLLAASPGLAGAASQAPDKPVAPGSAPAVIPGTDALQQQVASLGVTGEILKAVSDLVAAILKAPDGKVPEADAAKLKAAIDGALAKLPKPPADLPKPPADLPKPPADLPKPPADAPKLPAAAPKLPADAPKLPAAPKAPLDTPKLPADASKLPLAVPKLPVAPVRAAGPVDLVGPAVEKLKKAVDGALKASGSCGCSTDATTKSTDVVTSLVGLVTALLTGSGLPGLPVAAPALPVPAPALPVQAPALPVE